MVGAGGMLQVLCVAICAGLMAAAGGEAATSVIILGMAQCPSCSRKSISAEAAFKGLKVAIKCNNGSSGGAGEHESKAVAVGDLDGTGAFAVPLPADVDLARCVAQLHSAASSAPCPGQEPSKIVPLSDGDGSTTFVAVAGKTTRSLSSTATPDEYCASANICFPCRVFGRKPFYGMHRHMKPLPDYGMPSTPVYYPAPVYGTPAPRCMCSPTPEPGCQCPATPVYGTPMPEYYPPPSPTPVYGTPTPDCPPEAPEYGTPGPRCMCYPTMEAGCQCPTAATPAPVYGTPAPRCMCSPTPEPGCMCPTSATTPVYGTPMALPPPPTPVYGTPPAPVYGGAVPTPDCPPGAAPPSYSTTPPAYH